MPRREDTRIVKATIATRLATLAVLASSACSRAPDRGDPEVASANAAPHDETAKADRERQPVVSTDTSPFIRPLAKTWTGDLDGMIDRRAIRVLITPTRTQYWIDKGQQTGVEYELLQAFEGWINKKYRAKRHVNIHVVFIPTSRADLIPGLQKGWGDVAAGVLTVTPERLAQVDYGGPLYRNLKEVPVTGPRSPAIATLDDLAGKKVVVRSSSSYWTHLEELNRRFAAEGKPPIVLQAAPEDLADDDLMELANAGLIGVTVVDRYAARLWSKIFPRIVVHDSVFVHDGGDVGWMIRKDSPLLKTDIDEFARSHGQGTLLGNTLLKKYTGSTRFLRDAMSSSSTERYNRTVGLFRKYGDEYSLDPQLMLAQGYQESGLDQTRRSRVGAIGVMQIMPATGKQLKVGDISQLEPNIHGGVKYIRSLIDHNFADQPMDDLNRTLFAFAAYNAGPTRVRRLREKAAQSGLDPNVWRNNVELIAARDIGAETVTYVANIYRYYVAYRLAMGEQSARKDALEQLRGPTPAPTKKDAK